MKRILKAKIIYKEAHIQIFERLQLLNIITDQKHREKLLSYELINNKIAEKYY
jgi:hypothetical protein